jgi:acetoin utilization protein AcuB
VRRRYPSPRLRHRGVASRAPKQSAISRGIALAVSLLSTRVHHDANRRTRMRVGDLSHTNLVTVPPSATLADVLHLLNRKGVRHILVVEGPRVVGIISDRDIKTELALSAGVELEGQARTAGQMMTRQPITIAPTASIQDAAGRMVSARISALPVVQDDRLVGIVTETDLLRALSGLLVGTSVTATHSSTGDAVAATRPATARPAR